VAKELSGASEIKAVYTCFSVLGYRPKVSVVYFDTSREYSSTKFSTAVAIRFDSIGEVAWV
jgi:hypothetical protein